MTTKISKDFNFLSAVHTNGNFFCNQFNCTIYIDVVSEDTELQGKSMERIKIFFEFFIDNCIFIHNTEIATIESYIKAGIRPCTLPEEPYDQIIACALIKKLNAICEGNFIISNINLSSVIGDHITHYQSLEEADLLFTETKSWYNNINTSISDKVIKNKKDKVVELKKDYVSWDDFGLSFLNMDKECKEVRFINREK